METPMLAFTTTMAPKDTLCLNTIMLMLGQAGLIRLSLAVLSIWEVFLLSPMELIYMRFMKKVLKTSLTTNTQAHGQEPPP